MIPIYRPSLTSLERKYLLEAYDSGWISGNGPFVAEFEELFAESTGSRHAIAVFNGTVALHLALNALGVGRDGEVLVPDYTYVACANAVSYVGGRPVFFDADTTTYQPLGEDLLLKTTGESKAAIFAHLFGFPNDLSHLRPELDSKGIPLIEDCSEIFGAELFGEPAGNSGVVSTYSFFGNKTITTGEGGMLTTSDSGLADELRLLRNQAATPSPGYWFEKIGFNFRMTNLQGAIGLAQLQRAREILDAKRNVAERLMEAIDLSPEHFLKDPDNGKNSYWLLCMRLPSDVSRNRFIETCAKHGVDVRPGFTPMGQLPMYQSFKSENPNAETFEKQIVLLPCFPDLTSQELKTISDAVNSALN